MGRTVLPYSHVLESERERWKSFRRALSKKDQEAFDSLFDRAKKAYQCWGFHGPLLAHGNHPSVHLLGTRKDDRKDSMQAQIGEGLEIVPVSRRFSSLFCPRFGGFK